MGLSRSLFASPGRMLVSFTIKDFHLNSFSELGLSKLSVSCLEEAGFTEPTEIQTLSIGLILSGRDLLGSAQTGSGKTAAYVLPIVDRLGRDNGITRALVVVPTRELALQVKSQFDLLGRRSRLRTVAIYGGTSYDRQISALRRGADIVVATPGRLNDLVERRLVRLGSTEILVLDEADRLLDMGFMPQVRRIMAVLPEKRQTLLFSATIDQRVGKIASEFLSNPATVKVRSEMIEAESIEQKFHHVHEVGKEALLMDLINNSGNGSILIFTRTRHRASSIVKRLRQNQVAAEEIHSDISQNKREKTISQYRQGAFRVLVATDIAARGLDVPTISHVVNYDLPQTSADYVHRIGRTGRAGRAGIAHSFVSDDQRALALDIEKLIGRKLTNFPDLPVRAKTFRKPARRRFVAAGRSR
jgi:ATP-dependent RNA helicase RhlE